MKIDSPEQIETIYKRGYLLINESYENTMITVWKI